ncbi:hypothetical protein ACO0LB_04995 [Undibacterium sp. SXout7W]|uniref:hypothetical protein n=1 Tax=Undibacterium sp. SXout7W TaxID=3413049 RepID=UPI003BF2EC38
MKKSRVVMLVGGIRVPTPTQSNHAFYLITAECRRKLPQSSISLAPHVARIIAALGYAAGKYLLLSDPVVGQYHHV